MNAAQLDLWRKIQAFQVNQPGTRFTFEDRLARENRWTPEYARRVVGEYKRFLLLAMIAEHPVTPSDEVDQAWHLHMVYTESYWEELCGKVLPRALHHGPTKGGRTEDARFTNLYERTMATYRAVFGHEPPEDIWPVSKTRFGRAPHFQRVNTAENWVVPKPRLTTGKVVGAGASLVVIGLAGCAISNGPGGPRVDPAVWIFGIMGIGIVAMISRALSKGGGGDAGAHRRGDTTSSGCGGMWGAFGSGSDPGHHGHGHGHGHGDGQGQGDGHGGGHSGDAGGGHDGSSGCSGSGCSSSGCSSSGCSSSGCGGGGCSS